MPPPFLTKRCWNSVLLISLWNRTQRILNSLHPRPRTEYRFPGPFPVVKVIPIHTKGTRSVLGCPSGSPHSTGVVSSVGLGTRSPTTFIGLPYLTDSGPLSSTLYALSSPRGLLGIFIRTSLCCSLVDEVEWGEGQTRREGSGEGVESGPSSVSSFLFV